MRRNGFTLIEMLLVIAILGFVALLAIRPMRETQQSDRVRAAKVIGATYVVNARTTAINRGCRTTVHFTQGDTSHVWITSCKLTALGSSTSIPDTLAKLDAFAKRLGVTVATSVDSIPFDAQGFAINGATQRFKFTKGSPASVDSFVVSPLGMIIQ